MSKTLLELRDVSASYGSIQALSKVSLRVPEGAIIALLGGNGAGKTSTIECLVGLREADAGTLEVGGIDAQTLDVKNAYSHDQSLVIPMILALVFVVLLLLLRSIVAPVLLLVTVVASFFASLGAAWLVFVNLLGFPALDLSVFLYSFLFLVALGVDYNIFLVTRAKEEADKAAFDKLEKEMKERLEQNPKLQNLKDQVKFVREKDGLRIEIIDKADFAMFALGTTRLMPRAQTLLDEVSKSLGAMPNKVAVRGHTDSVAFANTENRNNWSLSAERAEATRQLVEKNGVKSNRFARIEGVADTAPYNPNDPLDARNRRISITVLYRD